VSKRPNKKNWHQTHINDPYVQKAKSQGYRTRATFKLEEIDQRHKLIRPGMRIIELGAAPGGWCQYVIKKTGSKGALLAIDRLAFDPVSGVDIIQGDITDIAMLEAMEAWVGQQPIDAVLSDMAPDLTGIRSTDQARSEELIEMALDTAQRFLKQDGFMLIKGFHGQAFQDILQQIRAQFVTTSIEKPKASRDHSRVVYVEARLIN
jgi:23S rRNA (uridine2552-2'-O)-methyltransferase